MNVGAIRGFYSYEREDPQLLHSIDDIWAKYEGELPRTLDEISIAATQDIDALKWARVLVPFIAASFVRGVNFNERAKLRMGEHLEMFLESFGITPNDNINLARALELQRLLAAFLSADLIVLHAPWGTRLISSDTGYALATDSADHHLPRGFVFPVAPRRALLIVPVRSRILANADTSGNWRTPITHSYLDSDATRTLNKCTAALARDFIVGQESDDVESLRSELALSHDIHYYEPYIPEFPSSHCLRDHDLEWFRAVSVLGQNFDRITPNDFDIDWDIIKGGWSPVIHLAVNRIMEISGLKLRNRSLWLHLEELSRTESDSLYRLK